MVVINLVNRMLIIVLRSLSKFTLFECLKILYALHFGKEGVFIYH
jgi:hypothetical protein